VRGGKYIVVVVVSETGPVALLEVGGGGPGGRMPDVG
jgi:hypothetical protein